MQKAALPPMIKGSDSDDPNSTPANDRSEQRSFRILLLEDQAREVLLLRRALSGSTTDRFEITHVGCLGKAIAQLRSHTFDAVLADLFLPDSAGPQTIVRLREYAPRVPIIAMASLGATNLTIQAQRAGADDYYVKRNDGGDQLPRMLRFAIERKREEERLHFLNEAGLALASPLDAVEALTRIATLVVPYFCDCCRIDLFDEDESLLRAEVRAAHAGSSETALQHLAIERVRLTASHGQPHAAADAHSFELVPLLSVEDPRFSPGVFGHERDFKEGSLGETRISLMVAPLMVGDRVLGSMSFYADADRRVYDEGDLVLAGELARRCALALESATLYNKVERALRSQQESLTSITHDLRNPLTAVRAGLGLIELSVADRLGPREKELMATVMRNIAQLGIMLEELIAPDGNRYSGISEQSSTEERFDLSALLQQVSSVVWPLFEHKQQALEVISPKAIPLTGDKSRVEHLLVNLLDKVRQYAPTGANIKLATLDEPCEVFLAIDAAAAHNRQTGRQIRETGKEGAAFDEEQIQKLTLALTRLVVELPDAHIKIEHSRKEEAVFHIGLPCAQSQPRSGKRRNGI